MKERQIPSRELYDAFAATGNANYSYEDIVAVLQEAISVNAEYEDAQEAAWRKFDEYVGGIDFLYMSDEQRCLYGDLSRMINEVGGVCLIAMKGSKEMVPVRRIQREIRAVRRSIKRINSFFNERQSNVRHT